MNGNERWGALRRTAVSMVLLGAALQSDATLGADKGPALAIAPKAAITAMPNPSLMARVNGVDDERATRRSLRISELNVDVMLVGAIAKTTVLAHFSNPTDEWLEGEFSLALPDDAVVIGYALDVEGRMLDGVLSEPTKARAAYHARIRRRVDPGVAEVSRANVFTTRIYPIQQQIGRTIRLTFVAPVHPVRGFVLPLVTDASVRNLKMSIRAQSLGGAPNITVPEPLKLEWQTQGTEFVASATGARVKLSGDLQIRPVAPVADLLTTVHPSGGRFFQLTDSLAKVANPARAPSARATIRPVARRMERVRIYWDRSLSRGDDALSDELTLIDRFIEAAHPAAIDVVPFNSTGAKIETVTTAAEVRQILTHLEYRGATSFAVLRDLKLTPASQCLVFSDGVVTMDPRDDVLADCRTTAITSAPDADTGYLHRLVRASGGQVVRLNVESADAALAALRNQTPRIVDVRDGAGRALAFTTFDGGPNGLIAVGEAPDSGEIVVKVSSGERRSYAVSAAAAPASSPSTEVRFDGAGALWAADRIALLAAQDSTRTEVRTTSRRYSVASPAMSFIVLESPQDYVTSELPLPKNAPRKWRTEYLEAKADHDEERADARASRLQDVISRWEEQKAWWAQDFTAQLERKKERDEAARNQGERLRRDSAQGTSLATIPAPAPMAAAASSDSALQEIVTTGTRRVAAGTSIEIEPWNPNRPYLKALERASADDWAATFAAQEKQHGSVPAFYLDVAEYLYRQNRRAEAEEMLLCALELPSANLETQALIADRLVRYGSLDRAIWLYGHVQELGPERPQPLRAMALALIKRAASAGATSDGQKSDLSRARDLLTEVIMTPWAEAYDGIELIALMDANALAPKLKRNGVAMSLDSRLIARLDVDLRVVIEWNTAATDMDLWLDEPTGERAVYSHPRTTLGGRLSNDMTEGYGPEEYLLRRAADGRYQIRVNAYARDQLNPNGATTVTAHLFRDFGRNSQREETMDLELRPGDEGELLVGQFVVKPAHGSLPPQQISEPTLSRQ